ncbi:LPO_1073/Vpar_1526 family protein [Aldersonia kunmingensis]|uniref:LPO_1073/Vpar_1526 family protein n=1 Tax=Aldersonia kunmingensis TaxID=408066 RepID=UPI00082AEB79|nr:LPO_1073/Vpar_1526 family protein [Aldersonia kunmingensis]
MKDQHQEGGDNSNLYQGQSLEVHNYGITAQEARDIAKGVFYENYLTLNGRALEEVHRRIDEFANLFLAKLSEAPQQSINNFDTARMLSATYKAQRQYVENGDQELAEMLADFLIAMAAEEPRSLNDIVLNQAVEVASKLTPSQIDGLVSILNVLWVEVDDYPTSGSDVFDFLHTQLTPYYGRIPQRSAEYEYMSALGVVSERPVSASPYQWLANGYPGVFVKGFSLDSLEPELKLYTMPPREGGQYFEPLPENENLFRIKLAEARRIVANRRADPYNATRSAGALERLLNKCDLEPQQIRESCRKHWPELAAFLDVMQESRAMDYRPNSVGIAIGHAAWRRHNPEISLDELLE